MDIMLFIPHHNFTFQLTLTVSTLQYVYILGCGMRLNKFKSTCFIQVIKKNYI